MISGDELAAIITALSLVLTAIFGGIAALKNKPKTNRGEERAASVSRIDETDRNVQTLIKQVEFLFDEISKLRTERNYLSDEIEELRKALELEKKNHEVTRNRLNELILELAKKDAKINELEMQLYTKTKEM